VKAKTVAILESRLGSQLGDLVGKHGGRPLLAPALAEVPDLDRAGIARRVAELQARPPTVAIFQTGVGTQALFRATDALGHTPALLDLLGRILVAARGPKPTAALRSRGVRIDRSAREPFTTAEVLDSLQGVALRGERVLVQRYGETNVGLDNALRAKGAYGASLGPFGAAPVLGWIRSALMACGVGILQIAYRCPACAVWRRPAVPCVPMTSPSVSLQALMVNGGEYFR